MNEDLLQILNTDEATNAFSLTSVPVILYLGSAHCDISNNELAIADDKQLKRVSVVHGYCCNSLSLFACTVVNFLLM